MAKKRQPKQGEERPQSDRNHESGAITQTSYPEEPNAEPQNSGTDHKSRLKTKLDLDLGSFIVSSLTLIAALTAAFCAIWLVSTTNNSAEDAYNRYAATQRPYITVKELKIDLIDGRSPDNGQPTGEKIWRFVPVFENSGNTITKNMSVYLTAVFQNSQTVSSNAMQGVLKNMSPVLPNIPPDPARFPIPQLNLVIAPHSTTEVGGIGIMVEDLKSNSPAWFDTGFVTYDDIFIPASHHESKFCYVVYGTPPGGQQKPHFELCGHWNCTDEECKADKASYDSQVGGRAR